jgi:parallel beta helix pectate lyase-like protein
MGKGGVLLTSLGLFAVLNGTSFSAMAASKVWVATWGSDAASCGEVGSPCATLQQAHDNVAAGGEIRVLAPGDYGSAKSPRLNITKAVTMVYEGPGEAGILGARDGTAILVNAGAGGVTLRGLTIDGLGIGANGVQVRSAGAVRIQNCRIRNFERLGGGVGIAMSPAADTQLFVVDTVVANNGAGAASGGIAIRPAGASASANVVLERAVVENNIVGLTVDGTGGSGKGVHILIRDSLISGNAGDGILITSAPGRAQTFMILERSAAVNNAGTGIRVEGPLTTVLLRDAVTTGNDTALSTVNGGQLISYRQHRQLEQMYRPVSQPLRKAEGADSAIPALLQANAAAEVTATDRPEPTVARENAAAEDVKVCPSLPKLERLKVHHERTNRRRVARLSLASYSFAKVRKVRRYR